MINSSKISLIKGEFFSKEKIKTISKLVDSFNFFHALAKFDCLEFNKYDSETCLMHQ